MSAGSTAVVATKPFVTTDSDRKTAAAIPGVAVKRFTTSYYVINIADTNFRNFPTLRDRASALHAVAGVQKSEFVLIDARKHFAKKLSGQQGSKTVQAAFKSVLSAYSDHFNCKDKDEKSAHSKNAAILAKASGEKVNFTEKAYTTACLESDFCFTRFDLALVAHAFAKRILVYSHLHTLEARFGEEYPELVVLRENRDHSDPNGYPCFERCTPLTLFERMKYSYYSQYRVQEILEPQQLEATLSEGLGANRNFSFAFQLILDYAAVPIVSKINLAMQVILEREEWNSDLNSSENKMFADAYQRRVTHIYCSPVKSSLLNRMEALVRPDYFPCINAIAFAAYTIDVTHCIKILKNNPNCRSLYFQKITIDNLQLIFNVFPHIAKGLESLACFLDHPKQAVAPASVGPSNFASFLLPLVNLQRLFLGIEIDDEQFTQITAACPLLHYFDLTNSYISIELIMKFIEKKKKGLQNLDLRFIDFKSMRTMYPPLHFPRESPIPANMRPNSLTLRNCVQRSEGSLLPLVATIPTLRELDISNIKFDNKEMCALKNLPSDSLLVLRMRFCYQDHGGLLEIVTHFTNLIELDITGCYLTLAEIHLLRKLKTLRILRVGGFCFTTRGTGESHFKTTSLKSAGYKKAIEEACAELIGSDKNPVKNPLEFDFVPVYEETHYTPTPEPKPDKPFRTRGP